MIVDGFVTVSSWHLAVQPVIVTVEPSSVYVKPETFVAACAAGAATAPRPVTARADTVRSDTKRPIALRQILRQDVVVASGVERLAEGDIQRR